MTTQSWYRWIFSFIFLASLSIPARAQDETTVSSSSDKSNISIHSSNGVQRWKTSTGVTNSIRYYTFNGTLIAQRTNSLNPTWVDADPQRDGHDDQSDRDKRGPHDERNVRGIRVMFSAIARWGIIYFFHGIVTFRI